MRNTHIEWCHHTVNFWWGCTKVSPACEHCYAETLAKLFSRGRASWGPGGLRWIRTEAALKELRALERSAAERGVVERVFINSMSDIFEDRADLVEPLAALLGAIPQCPHLQFLLLTKRPEGFFDRVAAVHSLTVGEDTPQGRLAYGWAKRGWAPSNVWMGVTVEDQTRADERHEALMRIPVRIHFWSAEPLLSLLYTFPLWSAHGGPDWVICGGESGSQARPMHPEWARSLRDQCQDAGVAFHFKQWGEWAPDFMVPLEDQPKVSTRIYPDGTPGSVMDKRKGPGANHPLWFGRVGKRAAGRVLDGRTWDEFPSTLNFQPSTSAQ